MVDEGLLILAATQAAIMPVGLAVLWLASRRPWTAAVLIVMVIAAALASVRIGSNLVEDHYDVGRPVYLAGIFGVIYGLPASCSTRPGGGRVTPSARSASRTGSTGPAFIWWPGG